MKLELKAKYLQYLNQQKQDEGFTLIELLVVIIIIGILSAIALPSFLSQANKAKQSEAKTYVGSINKGQQAYYTEKSQFEEDEISALGIGLQSQTPNYVYTTVGSNATTVVNSEAVSKATANVAALKGYAGQVSLIEVGSNSEVTSIAFLCEEKQAGTADPADPEKEDCAGTQLKVGED